MRKKLEVPPPNPHERAEVMKPYKWSLVSLLGAVTMVTSHKGTWGTKRESTTIASLDDGNIYEEL